MNEEILYTDMSRCIPRSAFADKHRRHHWQLIPYAAEGIEKGRLMSAGPLTEAPVVALPLDAKGWHAIYVGMWLCGRSYTRYALSTAGGENMGGIKVRLSDDPCFVLFRREEPSRGNLEEAFWKCADLSGRDIVISEQSGGFHNESSLAYVRLVKLSDAQVEELKRDRERQDTKRLIATNDAFGIFFRDHITTREGIWEHVEPYRNTDFKKLFWEVVYGIMGGWRPGRVYGEDIEDFPRIGDKHLSESMRILKSKGINPLKTAMDYAHSIGLEFHVSQRTEMFQTGPPFEEIYSTEFYRDNLSLRLVDRDGTQITGLSYAYPEVRNFLVSLFEEAAALGADGAAVIYPRSAPFLLYEKPVVEGFKQKFGDDPREVDETDERLLRFRAGFMTRYMRELRQAMDRVGKKLGRRLEVSAITFADGEANLSYGLDLASWIEGGLIDNLIAYPCTADHSHKETDIEYYAQTTRGTPCKLYFNLMPRHMHAAEYRRQAALCYEAGADGLFFWDTYQRHDGTAQWETVRKLGHVQEIGRWVEQKKGQAEPRILQLTSLGGHNMGRYSPYRGT